MIYWLQLIVLVSLTCVSCLPSPGSHHCRLVRRLEAVNPAMCFSEPECEEKCQLVDDVQCQTRSSQECRTVNEQKCSQVQEQVSSQSVVSQ